MGGSRDAVWALVLLIAADAAFLWMFFSTAPLEQLAVRDDVTDAALRFAAAWRHGMAGNAWVYMPGFFATAGALWLHARHVRPHRAHVERVAAAAMAFALAFAGALPASIGIIRQFGDVSGLALTGRIPLPAPASVFAGAYTLLTWSVFVLACRGALRRRSLRPFVPAAILAAGLGVVRPWTVDDFTSHWAGGVVSGHLVACASLALVFVMAALLAASERHRGLRGLPQPEPGQTSLDDGGSPRRQDEQRVGADGNRVEAW